jgi:hypothetical protein
MFGKDHATVVYSQEMIVYALDGFHPLLNEKLQDVLECIEIAQTESKDFNTSLIISSRHIERLLKTKYERLTKISM